MTSTFTMTSQASSQWRPVISCVLERRNASVAIERLWQLGSSKRARYQDGAAMRLRYRTCGALKFCRVSASNASQSGGTPSVDFQEIWRAVGVQPPTPPLLLSSSIPSGRGLVACKRGGFQTGDLLLGVPMRNVITVPVNVQAECPGAPQEFDTSERVPVDSSGQEAAGAGRQPPGSTVGMGDGAEVARFSSEAAVRLALELLLELQRPGSCWPQYRSFLPSSFECAFTWSKEETILLQSASAAAAAVVLQERFQGMAAALAHLWATALGRRSSQEGGPADMALGQSKGDVEMGTRESGAADVLQEGGGVVENEGVLELADSAGDMGAAGSLPDGSAAVWWALMVVLTRSFTVQRDGIEVQALVPVADMVNHGAPSSPTPRGSGETLGSAQDHIRETDAAHGVVVAGIDAAEAGQDAGDGQAAQGGQQSDAAVAGPPAEHWRIGRDEGGAATFELRAPWRVEEGQEVCISYGPYSDPELLLLYGFVPALHSNPGQKVVLYAGIGRLMDDVRRRVKYTWHKHAILTHLYALEGPLFVHQGGHARRLLSALLLLHAQSLEELDAVERAVVSGLPLTVGQVPARAETWLAACRHLAHRCQYLLERHPTTIEEDEALMLEDDDGLLRGIACRELGGGKEAQAYGGTDAGRARMAVAVRLSSKHVLRQGIKWAEMHLCADDKVSNKQLSTIL